MKNWKTVLAGLFIFCLLICAPLAVFAEEDGAQQEEETEEPVPESYDYPIESNEIKDWPQGPKIEAASATVLDMDSGHISYIVKMQTEKIVSGEYYEDHDDTASGGKL